MKQRLPFLVMAVVLDVGLASRPGVTIAEEPPRGAEAQPAARNEALRQELIRMATLDLAGLPGTIRQDNRIALDRIIAEHGWPGRSLVGVDGAQAAWLIAQHADFAIEFQKACRDLLEEAFLQGEAEGNALAYLTDRILDNEGSPQMYGTQGVGVFSPEDERRVDANRKTLGLDPWRVYFDKVKKRGTKPRGIAPWEGI